MTQYLWVFLGGGIGSVCRFALTKVFNSETSSFPFATFWANILACIILGILVGINEKSLLSQPYKLLFMTGFCGGFSTFSTFANENFSFFQLGQSSQAFMYTFSSLIFGVLAIFIGYRLGLLFVK